MFHTNSINLNIIMLLILEFFLSDSKQVTVESVEGVLYRAVFQFEARNQDELSFDTGDIITVSILFCIMHILWDSKR